METQMSVEEILKGMREIIGEQAQQISILKAAISSLEAKPTEI